MTTYSVFMFKFLLNISVSAYPQVHTQRYNLSLSTGPQFFKNATKTGSSVGMTTLLAQGQTQLVWYVLATNNNLTAVAYVQLYTQDG